jgi:hypothetical protein
MEGAVRCAEEDGYQAAASGQWPEEDGNQTSGAGQLPAEPGH